YERVQWSDRASDVFPHASLQVRMGETACRQRNCLLFENMVVTVPRPTDENHASLTPSAYAVLGLLAGAPANGYELRRMKADRIPFWRSIVIGIPVDEKRRN